MSLAGEGPRARSRRKKARTRALARTWERVEWREGGVRSERWRSMLLGVCLVGFL